MEKISIEKVKTILSKSIGKNNATSRTSMMRQLFDGYDNFSFLQKSYATKTFGSTLSYLRKHTDYFAVIEDNEVFVPTNNAEMQPYFARVEKCQTGLKKGKARAEAFIEGRKWKCL